MIKKPQPDAPAEAVSPARHGPARRGVRRHCCAGRRGSGRRRGGLARGASHHGHGQRFGVQEELRLASEVGGPDENVESGRGYVWGLVMTAVLDVPLAAASGTAIGTGIPLVVTDPPALDRGQALLKVYLARWTRRAASSGRTRS